MGDDNKWITTDNRSGRLVIRFKVKNYPKQFFIATGLKDTPKNRELVRSRRDLIANDIILGRFDPTLEIYQFKTKLKSIPALGINHPNRYSLGLKELWQQFTEFKKAILETTTILGNYRAVERYIEKLPTDKLQNATQIRDWLLKNTTHQQTWHLLARFSECCQWAVDCGLIDENPFAKLKIKKPKKKSNQADYRAYTLQQRDLIISAFADHQLYAHYAPLIKFLFWTGARLGEAFALTWGDINPECNRIEINKSCNLYHISKGTKNGKRRIFPAAEGSKLQQLLSALKPPPEFYNPKQLIFVSKSGKPVNGDILQDFWNGYSSRGRFYPGVVRSLAAEGKIPYLKPYATRHTFATWAIASGVTPDRVALWIGDEVQTVLKFYCHPNVVDSECPDF